MDSPERKPIWGTFTGIIDQPSFGRLAQSLILASTNNVPEVHLMLQSAGGVVGDGIALYNLIRKLPIPVVLYNSGSVHSIAVIAFLGAERRIASRHSAFMIHRTTSPAMPTTARQVGSLVRGLAIDDERTEAILRERANLNDEDWRVHALTDLYFNADDALERGIATEIGDFSPPPGAVFFSIT